MLSSLRVQGFRCFRDLTIERLGRVNLITGRNNVGKTCLLEAVELLVAGPTVTVLDDLLGGRGEPRVSDQKRGDYAALRSVVSSLLPRSPHGLQADGLSAVVDIEADGAGAVTLQLVPPAGSGDSPGFHAEPDVALELRHLGGVRRWTWRASDGPEVEELEPVASAEGRSPCVALSAHGIGQHEVAALWDAAAAAGREALATQALRILAPGLQDLIVIGGRGTDPPRAVGRMEGSEERVALKSLGDGMNRLFGLAVALVGAAGGALLVDEIENGLHFRIQPDVWRLVFETAQRLDVQVFATTHSWDCTQAFAQVAAEREEDDAVLIRLDARTGDVRAFAFEGDRLGIVARQQIEVR